MEKIKFTDNLGTFVLENADKYDLLYFPLAGRSGMRGCITPKLRGDSGIGQEEFFLPPVSIEDLRTSKYSRNFWLRSQDGDVWSVCGASALQQWQAALGKDEPMRLTAGPLWQEISKKHKDIATSVLSFAPCDDFNGEIMLVTIKNQSDKPITLSPTAAIPIFGRSADNVRDHRHVTSLLGRTITTKNGIIYQPTLSFDERGHNVNKTMYCVFGAEDDGTSPCGFYPSTDEFAGECGSLECPGAIINNIATVSSGSQLEGKDAMGGVRFNDITLKAMQEKTYVVIMCIAHCREEADKCLELYGSKELALAALERSKKYWKDGANISLKTGNPHFDNWMRWINIQPRLRRLFGCSFLPHHDYGRGGRGWRDLWQDCLGLLLVNPDGVGEMLVSNIFGVRMDGTNATIIGHGEGNFIADRNNIPRVWMDHGMWPLRTVELYIDISGDYSILSKPCTYFRDSFFYRGEKVDFKGQNLHLSADGTPYTGTVLEHLLLQNLTAFLDVGEHNHIRLRGADWNDALDMAKVRGESVAFTAAYAENLDILARLCGEVPEDNFFIAEQLLILLNDGIDARNDICKKREVLKDYCSACMPCVSGKRVQIKRSELIQRLRLGAKWIKENIRQQEWISLEDAGWFNGYYDNSGRRVEGADGDQIRMMLTGQVFAIMSGTATDEQTIKIIKAADRFLFDPSVGGYRLNTNFGQLKTDLGRMFGFAYGHKENGAVFCHMAVMYAYALYKRGFVHEGYKVIKALYDSSANFEKSRMFPGIPEYFDPEGRGVYCYLTGAAGWLVLTVLTRMFGVAGHGGDLTLTPRLTREQFDGDGIAAVHCVFAHRRLKIEYVNTNKKDYGQYAVGKFFINGILHPLPTGASVCIDRKTLNKLSSEDENIIKVVLE